MEDLLVQVEELNDITYMRLESFGEVEIISETLAIYGLKADIQYLDLIKKIQGVIEVEKDCKGFL